jgi:hypothetical protein
MTQLISERWEHIAGSGDFDLLDELLADDVVFESPVVHTPQLGRAITKAYLVAAVQVLGSPEFRWVNRWFAEINGVDIIRWNSEGRITHFKVMIRPLKAINALHNAMARQLPASAATSAV